MANLIVSNICNASCKYCFASHYLKTSRDSAAPSYMTLEEYKACLDFLDRSEIGEARLLGGEPTLHPQFPELVRLARERGKHITVFSHGAMPEVVVDCLTALPVDMCKIIVNMSANLGTGNKYKQIASNRIEKLKRLGERVMMGFNIQSPAFELETIMDYISKTGVQENIRLGIALPGPYSFNTFVHPKQYHLIGARIMDQAKLATKRGIRFEFDCGFVRCMFSDDDIKMLKNAGMKVGFNCSPILDICPGGAVFHCFSLADRFQEVRTNLTKAAELRKNLSARTQPFRIAGVYRECSTCAYKINGECSSGCLAAAIRRFQPAAFQVTIERQSIIQ